MDNDPLTMDLAVLREQIAQLRAIHADIGAKLAEAGGVLRCQVCSAEIPLGTAEQVAGYIREGWPEHCGQPRRWITASDLGGGSHAT